MGAQKDKNTFDANLETQVAAELSARISQEQLNKEYVAEAIRSGAESIAKRMRSLAEKGLPSDMDSAIRDLAKTEKGFAFEALISSSHKGSGPNKWSYYGLPGSEEISPTDRQLDIKTISKDFFSKDTTSQLAQAKSSAREAVDAIKSGTYEHPIIVPHDVYEELSRSSDAKIREAIHSGKLIEKMGDSDPINSEKIRSYTERELHRGARQSGDGDFYKDLASEVGAAATVGAVFRGGLTSLKLIYQRRLITREGLREVALESATGGLQTGARVGIARGLEKALISKGIVNSGGRWLGRASGAAAGLVVSSAVDLFSLARGKITPGEFGLNISKNLMVAVCTAVSGPLGLGVSLGITATELVYRARKANNAAAEASFTTLNVNEQKINKMLVDMRSDIQGTKDDVNEQKKIADETLTLLKRRVG